MALWRRARLAPQPEAGVAYWSLAGVVFDRSAATEAEELAKSLSRRQTWARQPRFPFDGVRDNVAE
jgi:hypothetical protein